MWLNTLNVQRGVPALKNPRSYYTPLLRACFEEPSLVRVGHVARFRIDIHRDGFVECLVVYFLVARTKLFQTLPMQHHAMRAHPREFNQL